MDKIRLENAVLTDNEIELVELLNLGLDPNYESGNLLRSAARFGSHLSVKILLQYGADPHLIGDSGASTLQLAVYSGKHWDSAQWDVLLSRCDSTQLADGAAVAIVFNNKEALLTILKTGRCNIHVPTSLTGKTVDELARGYRMSHLLHDIQSNSGTTTPMSSPRGSQIGSTAAQHLVVPAASNNGLSPSVARFFHQTSALSPNRPGYQSPRNK